MKNASGIQLLILVLACFQISTIEAQSSATGYDAKKTDKQQKVLDKHKNYDVNFDVANHEAYFPEREDSLFRYLYSKLIIPKEAVEANLVANAMVSFQVNFDGKVMKANSINKVGYGIDEQLISNLNGLTFIPAKQGNTPYRSEIILEIPIKATYLSNTQEAK
jgi:hypothetical protein